MNNPGIWLMKETSCDCQYGGWLVGGHATADQTYIHINDTATTISPPTVIIERERERRKAAQATLYPANHHQWTWTPPRELLQAQC